ncbi:MAG: anthranilate synthase component I family protein [Candidatus Calescibacterium sp.]|nr:anthranilate synthase component I family protein [Candidatus Calescibacterium sp.]MCX7733697.1 anthranilate synthase component I family protein [bacterium]
MNIEKVFLDADTPISLFLRLKYEGLNPIFLLESAEEIEKWGRYSFLGFGTPSKSLKFSLDEVQDIENPKTRIQQGQKVVDNMNKILKEIYKEYNEVIEIVKSRFGIKRIPFGLVGYISYDCFSIFDRVDTFSGKEKLGVPDIYLTFTPNLLIFDNLTKDVILISKEINARDIETITSKGVPTSIKRCRIKEIKNLVEKKEFEDIVKEAIRRIYRGDVIQVVLSRAKEIEGDVDLFSLYRAMRILNPSPYMYFLDFGDIKISGTSPEVLVRVENKIVETRPIAGTRKRGETPEEDENISRELLEDEKELAEHLMLVDLARNDLGRVCISGKVRVRRFGYIEKYSRVMHIVSDVVGETDKEAIDVLKACFPAGTVAGAPKIEAAEIIHDLETKRRGPYAGAIGYFSADGNMDSAILIRTAFSYNNKITVQAGAGIVYYSVPEKEFYETEYKMQSIFDAMKKISVD